MFGISLADWNVVYVLLLYVFPVYEGSASSGAHSRLVRQKLERPGVQSHQGNDAHADPEVYIVSSR